MHNFFFCLIFFISTTLAFSKEIKLEVPKSPLKVDILEAFKKRKSHHKFSKKDVPIKLLSTILWFANGVNRKDGKKTAPSPFGKDIIKIYIFSKKGIQFYDEKANTLKLISKENHKNEIGATFGASGIKEAPLVLVFTGDQTQYPFIVKKDIATVLSYSTAGTVAQNIYLAAAALKLGTRMIASIDKDNIKKFLKLPEKEIPLYIMPLGFPK